MGTYLHNIRMYELGEYREFRAPKNDRFVIDGAVVEALHGDWRVVPKGLEDLAETSLTNLAVPLFFAHPENLLGLNFDEVVHRETIRDGQRRTCEAW